MEYQKGLRTCAGGVRRPVTWDFSALGGTRTPNLLIRSQIRHGLVGVGGDHDRLGPPAEAAPAREPRGGARVPTTMSWPPARAAPATLDFT